MPFCDPRLRRGTWCPDKKGSCFVRHLGEQEDCPAWDRREVIQEERVQWESSPKKGGRYRASN